MTVSREDVVVIGAGIGGLATALRLAHAGFSVTVVEAQPTPGGKMRQVPSPAGPVDAGPTVMTLRRVFEALFSDCGLALADHVTLHAEPLLARHWWPDGSTLDLFANEGASADAIAAFSGAKEARRFRSFCARARRLFTAFDAPMMQAPAPNALSLTREVLRQPALIPAMAPLSTLASALARQFRDPRLRQLFGRYATYVGGSPYEAPAILSLIWEAEAGGVWRVEGGMHALALAVARAAEAKGARFRYGTAAERIEVQQGRAAAVHLADGTRLAADRIVFNGDPAALAAGYLGDPARAAVPQKAVSPRSLSAWVWSFAATPEGKNLAHHNVFFCDDYRAEFEALRQGDMPPDPTLYICAEDRGTGRTPPPLERFEIIMNAPPTDRAMPLPEESETCRTRTFETLDRFGLTFTPRPDAAALTRPRDFATLFPGSNGSLYGRSPHGMMAAFARPTARTALPGLYLAGGGAHPGAGIPMATLSGRHAAAAIMSDRASRSTSRPTVTPGGMSTRSRTAAPVPSRSSPS